jgi:hypothetical protein
VAADRPDVHADPKAFFDWFYAPGIIAAPTEVGPELAEERWHPDVVVVQAAEVPDTAGEFHGYDGLDALFVELSESIERMEWNPVEITPAGKDRFLVDFDPTLHTPHGMTLSWHQVGSWIGHLVTLHADGRVLRLEAYLDESKAREAAGLG